MKYDEFKALVKKYPYFRSNLFPLITDNPGFLRRQVSEWVKKDRIVELKRGLYTLQEALEDKSVSGYLLANVIYSPSYISLESALSHYGMIPERVEIITSVASKKTQTFENKFAKFIYRHIKQNCFDYFIAKNDENNAQYVIATPEKAILDYLYFKLSTISKIESDYFTESLRLQNLSILDTTKLQRIAKLYHQDKLMHLTKILVRLVQEE